MAVTYNFNKTTQRCLTNRGSAILHRGLPACKLKLAVILVQWSMVCSLPRELHINVQMVTATPFSSSMWYEAILKLTLILTLHC